MRTHIEFYPTGWEWRDAKPVRRRPVEGIGINDVNYIIAQPINGKQLWCPAYMSWQNMLYRCYNAGYHQRYPTYIGTTCHKIWFLLSNFRGWYFRQRETIESFGYEGPLHLDKDILSDTKTYSPANCLLIPPTLNTLLNGQANSRGDYPIGVGTHQGKFRARVRINGKEKSRSGFNKPEEAAKWRLKTKLDHVMNYPLPPWLNETIVRPRLIEIVRNQK